MAKYTNEDTDVLYLDPYDRVAYNFEMLKYDVDQNQELRHGAQSITLLSNPELIGKMFKSPQQFAIAVLAIATFIVGVLIVVCIIIYIVLYIKGGSENEARKEALSKIFLYIIVVMLILVFMYWFFNKIMKHSIETGYKIKT